MNASHHVAAAKTLTAEINRLEAQRRVHTDALIELAKGQTGKVTVDTGTYTVSENNNYSEAAMRALLLPGQQRRVSKTVIDKTAVKRLYSTVYEASKERKGFKVTVS